MRGPRLAGAPAPVLDEIDALGADAIRIQVSWRAVAPSPDARRAPSFNATDPDAYPPGGWARYDAAIAGARERGLRVLVSLAGPAPDWATPRRDGLTRPSSTAFGPFFTPPPDNVTIGVLGRLSSALDRAARAGAIARRRPIGSSRRCTGSSALIGRPSSRPGGRVRPV